jgi:general secretion pathway protein D
MAFRSCSACCLLLALLPLAAGDPLTAARTLEEKEDWDGALEQYLLALKQHPSDLACQIAVYRVRTQAAQAHLDRGLDLRAAGKADEAAREIRRARELDPTLARAVQELKRPAAEAPEDERLLPLPKLRPLNPEPLDLTLVNQPPKVLYETLGRIAGVNVLVDPEFQPGKNASIALSHSTISQAFDDLALLTKTFWKTVSANTIFVTNDTAIKRHDYEDMVTRTFYLRNINTQQEIQEVVNAVRAVAELPRVVPYSSQYAIVVRAEADRVALAAKIIRDLDKPRAEVLVDFLILEAGKTFSRQLTAAIASSGLNVPLNFSPRSGLQVTTSSSSSSSSSSSTTAMTAAGLGHLSSADFSITLPGAVLNAALSDSNTRVLQAPQLRAIDNVKSTLKVGERQPTASGSYSPGVGSIGVNALVNTQFTYLDVGVNIDITPRVHDDGEISMHVELDLSSVTGQVNLGGINEPVIGQRKLIHDIRVREGQVNLLGGLTEDQETKSITGIPGLSSIPLLGHLFSGNSQDRSHSDLIIVLVPHILRAPDVPAGDSRGVAAGNAGNVKLNYGGTR